MKSAPAIGFEYHASRMLVAATVLVAMLAVVAVWVSGLPSLLRLLAVPCIAGWAGCTIARMLRPNVRTVSWQADGTVRLLVDDRRRNLQAEVQGLVHAARMLGPLIVLTLRWPPRANASLWLLPDNLDVATRRLLRMRLGAVTNHPASGNADSG